MNVSLKIVGTTNVEGMCPECKEYTTAGESCCGAGAYVDGGHVSDESAHDAFENPTVCIKLLVNAPEETARSVHKALFDAGVSSTMFSTSWSRDNKWNVNIFVPITSIVTESGE